MKPDYKIPLMSEINKVKYNGYTHVSTFSGCGGSCLGFKMAGFNTLWANEFVLAARETYEANYPEVILDGRDIRYVKPEDILNECNIKEGELDVFEGSPPCSDFSMAGKRRGGKHHRKKYSDKKEEVIVDDLFFQYARLLKGLQPKVFIAENVKGLTLGDIGKKILGSENKQMSMFNSLEQQEEMNLVEDNETSIIETLINCGYVVKFRVLNSANYGVPQSRERLFIIGVRNDLKLQPVFPKPLAYQYTVKDAIYNMIVSNKEKEQTMIKGKTADIVKQLKPGQSGSDVMGKGSYFSLKRLEWNKQAGTIQQSEAKMPSTNQVHPDENRRLTITELKRIGGFPDDFILTGTFAQQWERIGRAVSPPLMHYLAKAIKEEILDKAK
jgi:DNA (cytosine-5)-methyltransferase 1